jgi:glycerophosphoryl diester phosphodiesterase
VENAWLDRRVLSYAHQGGAKEAPSSTLFAIERAIGLGVDAIELDVHATADGELVVSHDPFLDRTSDGKGPIAARTLAELARLDNAYYFVEGLDAVADRPATEYRFRGRADSDHRFGLARLEEVLSSFADVPLNLDIKQTAPAVAPYEQRLATMLAAHRRSDDVIVGSFFDQATEAFSALAPGIGTAPGLNEVTAFVEAVRDGSAPEATISRHVALQVPARFAGQPLIDARLIEVAHDFGLAVHAWTVDEPDEMAELVALGVDGIMSDRPSLLIEVLTGLDVRYRPRTNDTAKNL